MDARVERKQRGETQPDDLRHAAAVVTVDFRLLLSTAG
jgi:hypothetical protein